jgi:hypothetical protein
MKSSNCGKTSGYDSLPFSGTLDEAWDNVYTFSTWPFIFIAVLSNAMVRNVPVPSV